MQKKPRIKKVGRPNVKRVCCSLLKNVESEIETYIQELIKARDDSGKMKWAWGIITAVRQVTEVKDVQKGKFTLCPKCKSYLEPRRRLAELVIQGCGCY